MTFSTGSSRKVENLLMNIYLHTISDMVGRKGLKSILAYVHLEKYYDRVPPENNEMDIPMTELIYLYHSLFDLYAYQDAQHVLLSVGQNVMKYAIEKYLYEGKTIQLSRHIGSESEKIRLGLEKFVEESETHWPTPHEKPHTELQEFDTYFHIIEHDCFFSADITSDTPVCFVYVGELEYLVTWCTGYPHMVEEIECRAMGHPADVFRVWKHRDEKMTGYEL
ncbi:MAG: hypothetical protein HXS47_02700 [Theionarchaea archaeon]|nr:hypothetical protein [Theionarchaea archaeon]